MIQQIDGKNVISAEGLEELMYERDKSISRINLATETACKLRQAKTVEEYNSVCIPDEFKKFGQQFEYSFMESYVAGFSISDEDGTHKCRYGNMGSLASIVTPTLYRGELCDYGYTAGFSKLGRDINQRCKSMVTEDRYFHFLLDQIRRIIFWGFIISFRQYCEFPFGEPIDGLIAQHYGLSTQFLDLTDDIKVALFFACCKHIGNNNYVPVSEDDVNKLGQYGVIYRGVSEHAAIIGYQPFCRCHRQRGYYIDTAGKGPCWQFDLRHLGNFDKFYFERTVELSKRIYDEFEGGNKLFPEDGLTPFTGVIDMINETEEFPLEAFEIAYKGMCKYLNCYRVNGIIDPKAYDTLSSKEYWLCRMEEKGFRLSKQIVLPANSLLIDEMNRKWNPDQYAIDESILYTPFLVIPANDLYK